MWTVQELKSVSFAFLTSVSVFAAYGCSSSTSQLSEDGNLQEVQFVIMGGNSTCHNDDFGNPRSPLGNDIDNSFRSMLAEVNAGNRFATKWIVSCHTNGNATVYYSTSESMNQVFQTTPEQFIEMITGNFAATGPRSVFLAGHSYGGWLAMKTVVETAPDRMFDGVFSIDPISRVHCTFANPAGCTSAPRDISNEQRTLINERSAFWANFYQTKTFYLHSAPMEEADFNLKLDASHTSIDNNPIVWNKIRDTVVARLAHL